MSEIPFLHQLANKEARYPAESKVATLIVGIHALLCVFEVYFPGALGSQHTVQLQIPEEGEGKCLSGNAKSIIAGTKH